MFFSNHFRVRSGIICLRLRVVWAERKQKTKNRWMVKFTELPTFDRMKFLNVVLAYAIDLKPINVTYTGNTS